MRTEVAGRAVELTATEFGLLKTLAASPGRIFTRSQLLDEIRGVAFESYERAIDSHIKNLRRKLEPDPSEPRYVLTVYGVGYRFADDRRGPGMSGPDEPGRPSPAGPAAAPPRDPGGPPWRDGPPLEGDRGAPLWAWRADRGRYGPWDRRDPALPRDAAPRSAVSAGPGAGRSPGIDDRGSAASSPSCSWSSSARSSPRPPRSCRTSGRSRSSSQSWRSWDRGRRCFAAWPVPPAISTRCWRPRAGSRRATTASGSGPPGPICDPIQELARGFDTMTARLETDEEQRRTLLADVSHELRTPLTVITGNLEAIVDGVHPPDPGAPELDPRRDPGHGAADRGPSHRRPVRGGHARAPPRTDRSGRPDRRGPAGLRAERDRCRGDARSASTEDLPILDIDPVRIREVLSNLVANALRHTPAAARSPSAARRPRHRVILMVSDTRSGHRPGAAAARLRPVRQGRRVARLRARPGDRPRPGRGPRRDDHGRVAGRWRHHVPGRTAEDQRGLRSSAGYADRRDHDPGGRSADSRGADDHRGRRDRRAARRRGPRPDPRIGRLPLGSPRPRRRLAAAAPDGDGSRRRRGGRGGGLGRLAAGRPAGGAVVARALRPLPLVPGRPALGMHGFTLLHASARRGRDGA